MLLSSQNKVSRAGSNCIKKMQINWESFAIVGDKRFHVEIRAFLMTCSFDLFLTCLLDLVSKMFRSVSCFVTIINFNDEKGNLKHYFSKDSYLKILTLAYTA